MDGKTFDALTRGVGADCTRRRAIGGILAGVLGLAATRDAAQAVETAKCAKKGDDCLRNSDCCSGLKCDLSGGGKIGECIDKNNSDDRCRDDRDCRKGERCVNKRCKNKGSGDGDGREGDKCNDNDDCRSGLKCKKGRCRDDDKCGREGDRCQTNGDCCNALVCDRDKNKCKK